MKDYPFVLLMLIIGFFMVVISGYYYKQNFTTDSVMQGITETIRASAVANADNSSRIQNGELYVSKQDFEKDFKKRINSNNLVKIKKDAKYEFKYLDNRNGSIKAIRVIIQDGNNTFQATCKVNIATS
ncbi:hypothetical protein [Bacillus cereus]|nr:hypothetical protein [Bacillus cereus]